MNSRRVTYSLKAVDTTSGGWTAIASAPVEDRMGDVVDAFAFAPLPDSVPVHLDHTMSAADLVGRAQPYYDALGVLHVDGTFAATTKAQEVRELIRDGFIDSMSIVFMTSSRVTGDDGLPHVVAGELLAVDFVSVPALREAQVVAVRSFKTSKQQATPPEVAASLREQMARLAEMQSEVRAQEAVARKRYQDTKAASLAAASRDTVVRWRGANLDGWPWEPMQRDTPPGRPAAEAEPVPCGSMLEEPTGFGMADPEPVPLGTYDMRTGQWISLPPEGGGREAELERRIAELERTIAPPSASPEPGPSHG